MNTKLLNVLSDMQVKRLNDVCNEFQGYSPNRILKNLWNLTYRPEFALEKMGLGDDPVFLEYFRRVRNEIYQQVGNNLIIIEKTDKDEELYKGLFCDKLAYWRIKDAISKVLLDYPLNELERISFLLNSKNQKYQHGALRALRLNPDEAKSFLQCIDAVAKYYNRELEEIKENITKSNKDVKPLDETENKLSVQDESSESTNKDEVKSGAAVEEDGDMLLKIAKNKELIMDLYKKADSLGTYVNSCVKDMISDPEILKVFFTFIQAWDILKSVLPDINKESTVNDVLRYSSNILNFKKIVQDIEELNKAGINSSILIAKRDIINGFFTL